MIRTFKYPLRPTPDQRSILESWLGACCALYNGALEERRNAWKKLGKTVSYIDQTKSLTEIRSDDSYWSSLPLVVLRSGLKRLDLAYKSFFRRVKMGDAPGFPRFRKRSRYDSFSLMSQVPSIKDRVRGEASAQIRIPKLGWVKFHQYRPLKGKVLDVLFKQEAGKWFVLFQCDLGQAPAPIKDPKSSIGIDVGLNHFATLSDGSKVENPRFFRASEELLARRQSLRDKRRRGNNARKRAKLLVQKAHQRIKNQRLDFTRKLAKSLVNSYDMISFEDLQIRNMVRSTLGKSINDAAWGQFIQSVICKAEEAGKLAIGVDPRGTSQRCSGCGAHVPKGLADRWHTCSCGTSLDRDHNSAINIDALGYSVATSRKGHAEALEVSHHG